MVKLKLVFARAVRSLETGDYQSALDDFVWLHDNPDPQCPPSEMFRRVNGFSCWALLGLKYPPAIEKMKTMLAEKATYLQANPGDQFVRADVGAMRQAIEFSESLQ